METIDQHRGILHGGNGELNAFDEDDAYVIDLKKKVFRILSMSSNWLWLW